MTIIASVLAFALLSFLLGVITGKFLAIVARNLIDVESAIKEVSKTSTPF